MKFVIEVPEVAVDPRYALRKAEVVNLMVDGGLYLPCTVVGELVEEAHDGYRPDGTYGHVHREVVRPI